MESDSTSGIRKPDASGGELDATAREPDRSGQSALAAVGNSNVVMFLMFGVMFGFTMATTVMVAQCVGAKNVAEAKRVVGTSAVFFLGLSVSMSVLGFAITRVLLAWLRTPPDALPFALAYMRIIFLAYPFMGGLFFVMAIVSL